ncbi:SufD family Fe-S cluster assembly protein [Shigella flexneri]
MDAIRNRVSDYVNIPSCILRGDNSIGEFYSVALTSGHQQADTGTKMIHIGKTPNRPLSRKRSRPDIVRTVIAA